MSVNGYCDPAFRAIRNAFAQNFETRGEIGASCCLVIKGKTYVDIWGGYKDRAQTEPWGENTFSVVFSNAKAATALCAHILIERGQLDPDARVTDYWPEFGAHGKDQTTVRMMMSHQSGVPAIRESLKPGAYYDFDYMVARLTDEAPFWEPGTDVGYHFSTYGWTVGELIRRISGQSLGTFFKNEVSGPLGLDFHIGLAESEFHRVARMTPYGPQPGDPVTRFAELILSDRSSIPHLAFMNNGQHKIDSPEAYGAEFGGGGGISNARGLAQMYDALINTETILPRNYINIMRAPEATTDKDLTLQVPTRFAQGFMLRMDNQATQSLPGSSLLIGEDAFGHTGMGGSVGFADMHAKMSFGYTMTKMGGDIFLGSRGRALVEAAYSCL